MYINNILYNRYYRLITPMCIGVLLTYILFILRFTLLMSFPCPY